MNERVAEIRQAIEEAKKQGMGRGKRFFRPELREAVSAWLARRYGIAPPDPASQVLPVNGSREALFSFAQAMLAPGAKVVCPNPFYQIYEGAALLGGARPEFLNASAESGFALDPVLRDHGHDGMVRRKLERSGDLRALGSGANEREFVFDASQIILQENAAPIVDAWQRARQSWYSSRR